MNISTVKYEDSMFYAWENIYLAYFDILSPISGFINLFAIIVVLCKSPKKMGAYKWHLLNYQVLKSPKSGNSKMEGERSDFRPVSPFCVLFLHF